MSFYTVVHMAGKFQGLQTRLKIGITTAIFVPCCTHSLKLVANCAAESCERTVHFPSVYAKSACVSICIHALI